MMPLSHNLDDDWDDLSNEVMDILRDALEYTDENESSLDPTAIPLEQLVRATTSIHHRFGNETGDIVWHTLTLFFDTTRFSPPHFMTPGSLAFGVIVSTVNLSIPLLVTLSASSPQPRCASRERIDVNKHGTQHRDRGTAAPIDL